MTHNYYDGSVAAQFLAPDEPHTCSSQYKMRELPDPECAACTPAHRPTWEQLLDGLDQPATSPTAHSLSSPDSDWPPQFELMKLEAQAANGKWIPIFASQLEWMAKDGLPVRAIEAPDAAATPSKPVLDRDVIAALVLNMWTHGSSHLQIADEILRRLTNAAQAAPEPVVWVKDLLDLYFAPWGAAKAARFEAMTGDKPFDGEVVLKLIQEKLAGYSIPSTEGR